MVGLLFVLNVKYDGQSYFLVLGTFMILLNSLNLAFFHFIFVVVLDDK